MRNIFLIAKREFLATVATRAFIIGLLIVPAMVVLLGMVMPRLFNFREHENPGRHSGDRSDRPHHA